MEKKVSLWLPCGVKHSLITADFNSIPTTKVKNLLFNISIKPTTMVTSWLVEIIIQCFCSMFGCHVLILVRSFTFYKSILVLWELNKSHNSHCLHLYTWRTRLYIRDGWYIILHNSVYNYIINVILYISVLKLV